MMKNLLFIVLGFGSLNAFAVNPTQGPLQQNPALCSYGYNPNCNQRNTQSPQKIINTTVIHLPSKYGAIANDKSTATIGSSLNMNSRKEAEKAAIQSCQNGNRNLPCKIVASYGNGCISAVGGRNGGLILFKAFDKNPGGYAEQKAMDRCRKSGASECQVLIREECSLS